MSDFDSILGRYAFAMKQDRRRQENHQKAKQEIRELFETTPKEKWDELIKEEE